MPLYSHIMMPTHQYNRRTLLMMQNLHNNYLYNANTGIIFTRRGWNGSMMPQFKGTIKESSNCDSLNAVEVKIGGKEDLRLGALGERQIELEGSAATKCDPVIKDSSGVMQSSILGEPINIQNFIAGAKLSQQQQRRCVSIVDDDCKLMPDRRYLAEVKNMHFQRLSSSGLEGSQLTV